MKALKGGGVIHQGSTLAACGYVSRLQSAIFRPLNKGPIVRLCDQPS